MSWALKVENLSKLYRVGSKRSSTESFYDTIASKVKKIFSQKENEVVLAAETLARSENHMISESQVEGAPPGHFWALKNVSFEIEAGDRVAIIGQNGSGKSTLLKILSRITAPTTGQFRQKGHLISLLEVGTGFHIELSGRENVYLNAAINGMSRKQINAKFNEIVEFSELGEHIDSPVKRYSSGMYMRLAFSVAAFLESEILLIDEVLAVGDAGFQKKCTDKMLAVANEGRTLIFVSHDMNAVQKICNKAIELSHGQIVRKKVENEKQSLQEDTKETSAVSTVSEVAQAYMQAKFESVSEKSWMKDLSSAPSFDNCVRLLSCRVTNQQAETISQITVNDPVTVEIVFEVVEKKYAINAHIYVSTATGASLLCSMDNLALENPEIERAPGIYTERVTIPRHFLNEGVFYVSVSICTHPTGPHNLMVDKVLTFTVTESQIVLPDSVRGNWNREWPAYLLRPKLHWNIQYRASQQDRHIQEEKEVSTIG